MPELTRREHVIGWASLVVLIAVFLPWESLNFTAGAIHFDGWTTGLLGWGGALLLAASGEYLIVRRLEYRVWAPRFGDSRLAAAVAAIGLILVIARWVTLPTLPDVDSSSSYGLWLAVAAGVVQTVATIAEARGSGQPGSS